MNDPLRSVPPVHALISSSIQDSEPRVLGRRQTPNVSFSWTGRSQCPVPTPRKCSTRYNQCSLQFHLAFANAFLRHVISVVLFSNIQSLKVPAPFAPYVIILFNIFHSNVQPFLIQLPQQAIAFPLSSFKSLVNSPTIQKMPHFFLFLSSVSSSMPLLFLFFLTGDGVLRVSGVVDFAGTAGPPDAAARIAAMRCLALSSPPSAALTYQTFASRGSRRHPMPISVKNPSAYSAFG